MYTKMMDDATSQRTETVPKAIQTKSGIACTSTQEAKQKSSHGFIKKMNLDF
jgi:hypothetical protein